MPRIGKRDYFTQLLNMRYIVTLNDYTPDLVIYIEYIVYKIVDTPETMSKLSIITVKDLSSEIWQL
jgi:hypothetical protein